MKEMAYIAFFKRLSGLFFRGFRIICLDIYEEKDKINSAMCKLNVCYFSVEQGN